MTELRMCTAGVDNGSHFNMNLRTLTGPAWKNMFTIENEPGKDIGSVWNIRSPSFRYNGYEAPVVNFTGIIDTSLTALGSFNNGSLLITVERLGSMALLGSGYIIYPMIGHFLAKAGFDLANDIGSVPCIIDSITPTVDTNYVNTQEYMVNYNMQIRLVSGF